MKRGWLLPNRLYRLYRLPWRKRLLLTEAALQLAVSRLVIACVPFHRIARRLGTEGRESTTTTPAPRQIMAEDVGWAIETMARYAPWNTLCLAQALAASRMLARRGATSTIYFGVATPDQHNPFNAHAWLRCGDTIVTGAVNKGHYKVLTCFSRGD